MTSKHFEELAEILSRNKADAKLCEDIALFCKRHNSNFNVDKFYSKAMK